MIGSDLEMMRKRYDFLSELVKDYKSVDAFFADFASINRHQPGGEIGQTRFVCPGRGRTGSSPARAAK